MIATNLGDMNISLETFFKLPVDSVVAVQGIPTTETIFHRTGVNGWLMTRSIEGLSVEGYNNEEDIRAALSRIRGPITFTVLRLRDHTKPTDEELLAELKEYL